MLHLDQPVRLVASTSIPADGHNSTSQGVPPPLPARAPPVRISNNQQRPYDRVQRQSYPDAEGHGDYRDVAHQYDEDGEEEAEGEFQGDEEHGEGEGEYEAQELEPERTSKRNTTMVTNR